MRFKHCRFPLFILFLITVFVTSCHDDYWDTHYNEKLLSKSSLNLYQYLQSRSELSTFTQMIQKTGYDSILSKSQTFTVWAPDNEALKTINMSDTLLVRKIVTNHITRFSYTTLGISKKAKSILMMNNKLVMFSKTDSVYMFGGKKIVEPDIATQNGIIHIMGEYSPYMRNFWEFISETSELDSIRNYINYLTKSELDNSKSFKDGVFVDSVLKSTNYLFDNLAALKTEDSIYTAIIPNNTAWSSIYNTAMPYFKTLAKDGGSTKQIADVKKVIVNNLFFRGTKRLPLTIDSIISTSGNKFLHADRLFEGSQGYEMSNGYGYVTSQLKDNPSETWLKPIRIEAEYITSYGGITSNYTSSINSSFGTGYAVSGNYYLSLTDASSGSISVLFANFPIPSNLSSKYNIYCVFVPNKIVDSTDVRPYKVKFSISYVNSSGVLAKDVVVDANNSINTKTAGTFTSDGKTVQKMLVLKNFELPYRYVYPENILTLSDFQKSISLALKVTNVTAKSDIVKFNRNLKIDCIILEPVQ